MPEPTKRYVKENRDDLEYILTHWSSFELRAYAGALLIRGFSDPEVNQAIDDPERGKENL